MLAKTRQHVSVADLCRYVSVDGKFCNFSIDEIHARVRGRILARSPVNVRQQVPCPLIALANQQKVRIIEIANHRSQRDELRVVAKPEIDSAALTAGALKRSFDFATSRPRH